MDGWIDDSLASPHRALGPARLHQHTFRALDLPFLFLHFFLLKLLTGPPQLPFFRALHFQPASYRTLLASLKPFFGFAEVLQHALLVYFLIPLRVCIPRWPWMLVWLEPGGWHLYQARLKHRGWTCRAGGVRRCFLVPEKGVWDWCVSRLGASCICFTGKGFMICVRLLCACVRGVTCSTAL